MQIEQQSSSGIIDVSNVSIFLAISIISVLSIAISGLNTSKLTETFVQVKPCSLNATCPILSQLLMHHNFFVPNFGYSHHKSSRDYSHFFISTI